MGDHRQQNPCGAFGLAAALFPVADGGDAEAVSAGEAVLRLPAMQLLLTSMTPQLPVTAFAELHPIRQNDSPGLCYKLHTMSAGCLLESFRPLTKGSHGQHEGHIPRSTRDGRRTACT